MQQNVQGAYAGTSGFYCIVTLRLRDVTIHQYQIVGIICHEGRSHAKGHYVGYIRCKGQWRLFDDSQVELISDIVNEVDHNAVCMCFYVPITMVPVEERLGAMLIGSDNRRLEDEVLTRSKRARK